MRSCFGVIQNHLSYISVFDNVTKTINNEYLFLELHKKNTLINQQSIPSS